MEFTPRYLAKNHVFEKSTDNTVQPKDTITQLTFRQRFILHVRAYNITQTLRRRFFLVNLTENDIDFIRSWKEADTDTPDGSPLTFATDCCVYVADTNDNGVDVVKQNIEEWEAA